ncbi:carbon monoxide dehydrogenase subunit G [Nakamurella sp. A5-74]|uniref:Carbon monoxide dehydrogenase subunit G n=1 Tax=Nakamurella sp. A5-74 TaxID=3158264 RepID=A0AAU8DNA6_9ACTN
MKVSGSSVLHAPPAQVWAAVNDPAVLAGVIPGCDVFSEIGDGHFGMTVSLGVAAIKGSYSGEVKLYDKVESVSLTMRATGAGAPGTIDTTVAVRLTDVGDGTTKLDYDADAIVGGMVGGVGQRVLASVAKKTAGLFFAAIDDVLTGRKEPGKPAIAAPSGAVETGTTPPAVTGRPVPAAAAVNPLMAAAFGAISVLIGVLVGARIGSRRP